MNVRVPVWSSILTALFAMTIAPVSAANGHLHLVHAHRLVTLRAPDGTFSVGVPDSTWRIRIVNVDAATRDIVISPNGKDAPSVYIWEMLPVVDMATLFGARLDQCFAERSPLYSPLNCVLQTIELQARVETKKWSAADSMPVISNYAQRYGVALIATSQRARSESELDMTIAEHGSNGDFDHRAILRVVHIENPYLSAFSGVAEWSTIGFLTGCKARAGSLGAAEPDCKAVLSSFHPSRGWLNEPVLAAMRVYQDQVNTSVGIIRQALANDAARLAAINGAIQQVGQQQLRNEMDWIQTDIKVGHDWSNVLGNEADVGAPGTDHFWRVDDNYNYYCEDSTHRVWGTNVDSERNNLNCPIKLPIYSPQ